MRIPFKTETDAFRVALALGLLAGASIVVGVLASRAYGVILFAAGIAAGITFELVGREVERGSALREATTAPHPHGAIGGKRHILVVAGETLSGDRLRDELRSAGGVDVELDVLAPIMVSRSHHWAGDVDREREEASQRLEASLAWASKHGFIAKGEVGDDDPMLAIEDELRDFGADEVIIIRHPQERASWLANRMLSHLTKHLEIPVREIALSADDRTVIERQNPTTSEEDHGE